MSEQEPPAEDFAAIIHAIRAEYGVTQSEIARRIDVSPDIVSMWARRKRGTSRGPSPDTLRRIASAFPKFTEERLFASVGRRLPAPLAPEAEAEVLEYFGQLTKEQQQAKLIELRALAQHNQSGGV